MVQYEIRVPKARPVWVAFGFQPAAQEPPTGTKDAPTNQQGSMAHVPGTPTWRGGPEAMREYGKARPRGSTGGSPRGIIPAATVTTVLSLNGDYSVRTHVASARGAPTETRRLPPPAVGGFFVPEGATETSSRR
jgi:hypothetical protein